MEKKILELLVGDLVILKRHENSTAQVLFDSIQKDKERLSIFLPWPNYINSIQDELNWIQETNSQWDNKLVYSYGIFRKGDETFLGTLDVHNIHWKTMECEIGYWIIGEHEGKGYVTDAVKSLEKHFFDLEFNKLVIRCSARNERSANVPKACGYLLDGTLRSDGFDIYGIRDTFVFSKLKEHYLKNYITIKTKHDFKPVLEIAKKNSEHFTESGIEQIQKDFSFQSGLIYRSEDKIIGFILYFCNQGIAEIGWMGVNPNFQKKGIGTKLLNELKKQLKEYGVKTLQVRTLDESVDYLPYEKSRNFYRGNDFKKIKVLTHPENPECEAEAIFECELK